MSLKFILNDALPFIFIGIFSTSIVFSMDESLAISKATSKKLCGFLSCEQLYAIITHNRAKDQLFFACTSAEKFNKDFGTKRKLTKSKDSQTSPADCKKQFDEIVSYYLDAINTSFHSYNSGYQAALQTAEEAFSLMSNFEAEGKQILASSKIQYDPLANEKRNEACEVLRQLRTNNAQVENHLLTCKLPEDQSDTQSVLKIYNEAFQIHAKAQRTLDTYLRLAQDQINTFKEQLNTAVTFYIQASQAGYPDIDKKIESCRGLLSYKKVWQFPQETKKQFQKKKKELTQVIKQIKEKSQTSQNSSPASSTSSTALAMAAVAASASCTTSSLPSSLPVTITISAEDV